MKKGYCLISLFVFFEKKTSLDLAVVGEYPSKYMSFGITHDEYKGKKHKNYHMDSNPNMNDKNDSYMRKQLSCDNKIEYSPNIYYELKMSKKDDDYVTSLIDKRKQKKKKLPARTPIKVTHNIVVFYFFSSIIKFILVKVK